MVKNKSYYELVKLKTFEDRFEYLKLTGRVGELTFGYDRHINQILYRSRKWKMLRDEIIVRDHGCDLGVDGYLIVDKVIIHHINPLTPEDIEVDSPQVYNPDNLICTCMETHNAIHFGKELRVVREITRRPNDTCPWK